MLKSIASIEIGKDRHDTVCHKLVPLTFVLHCFGAHTHNSQVIVLHVVFCFDVSHRELNIQYYIATVCNTGLGHRYMQSLVAHRMIK